MNTMQIKKWYIRMKSMRLKSIRMKKMWIKSIQNEKSIQMRGIRLKKNIRLRESTTIIITLFLLIMIILSEAVDQRYSVKKVFLEISQNSQEACNFIKKESLAQVTAPIFFIRIIFFIHIIIFIPILFVWKLFFSFEYFFHLFTFHSYTNEKYLNEKYTNEQKYTN